jgi:hypothetical protein
MEVIIATVIATIAILALAYSFGTGRALVNRYELARMALAAAQRRMELLAVAPRNGADLTVGTHGPLDVVVDGRAVCRETWTVTAYADPLIGAAYLKQVTVRVTWGQAGPAESVQLASLLRAP